MTQMRASRRAYISLLISIVILILLLFYKGKFSGDNKQLVIDMLTLDKPQQKQDIVLNSDYSTNINDSRVQDQNKGQHDAYNSLDQASLLIDHSISVESEKRQDISFSRVHDDWEAPVLPDSLHHVDQTDHCLINQIQDSWILAPDDSPLNLSFPEKMYFSQSGQDKFLDNIFQNKTGGFFIECGAFDGERLSNTLYFERERGWNGLLIEANPSNFKQVISKHRNSYMLHACLSISEQAADLNFTFIPDHPYLSRLDDIFYNKIVQKVIHDHAGDVVHLHRLVQCFPFYSILAALGNPHVDFFSMDIEGSEPQVLKTIPFDKVDIDVFLIETCADRCKGSFDMIKSIMEPYGYKVQYIPEVKYDVIMSKI